MTTMESGARMAEAVACMRVLGAALAEVTRELGLGSVELEYDSGDGEVTMRGYDKHMSVCLGFTAPLGGGADE